jgi:hypothetical protein
MTTLTISNIAASSDFTESSNCPSSLSPTATCQLTIIFAPTAAGSASGTVTATDSASPSTQSAAVTGTGTQSAGAAAVLTPNLLAFGNETIGSQSTSQAVTLTNMGAAALAISSIVPTTGFTQTNNCPSSLSSGANCLITLNFAPTAAGPLTGAVTVTDSDSPSTQTVALTGVGAQAAGTITATSATTCGTGDSGTCTILTVSCPNITDITATSWVKDATVTPIGTVMLIVGLGGDSFYENQFTYGKTLVDGLNAAGFETAEIAFDDPNYKGGWANGPSTDGPRQLACRWAAVVNWVQTNVNQVKVQQPAPLCATGNSGGGGAIAYSLAHYGQDSTFSMVEITGGPPFVMATGCLTPTTTLVDTSLSSCPNAAQISPGYNVGEENFIDQSYGGTPCTTSDTEMEMQFLNDSVVSADANLNYPNTDVHFLYGGMDLTAAVPLGLHFSTIVTSKSSIACVADAPHPIADVLDGADKILNDIVSYCKLQ